MNRKTGQIDSSNRPQKENIKMSLKKTKNISIKDKFELENFSYNLRNYNFGKFISEQNLNAIALSMASKDYDKLPATHKMYNYIGKLFFEILENYGPAKLVTFKTDFEDSEDCIFLLRVVDKNNPLDKNKVIYFYGIGSFNVKLKNYPKYKYLSNDDEILVLNMNYAYFNPNNDKANELFHNLYEKSSLSQEEVAAYVDMIVTRPNGLGTQKIRFDFQYEPSDLDLHYGEGFSVFNEKLLKRFEDIDKGIVMFHGPPGTGKTHYVRRLLQQLNALDKRVILIPKNILGMIESPAFNQFMLQELVGDKVVFVIEDAESIITKRNDSGSQRSELISTLLNITDGILNDIFNAQVILTFNTKISDIDEALLRKGRLLAKYEFDKLSRPQAEKLAEHLGFSLKENKSSYSLADIYSLKYSAEDDILINQNIKNKEKLGFK